MEPWRIGIAEKVGSGYKIQIQPVDSRKIAVGYAWSPNSVQQAQHIASLMAKAPGMHDALIQAIEALKQLGVSEFENLNEDGLFAPLSYEQKALMNCKLAISGFPLTP